LCAKSPLTPECARERVGGGCAHILVNPVPILKAKGGLQMKVANVLNDVYDVYGGRAIDGSVSKIVCVDGWLGNPFVMGKDGNREEVIRKYKRYFWNRINNDQKFFDSVMLLENKIVGCFCSPKPCHLNVIKDWFDAGCPLIKKP